MNNSTKLNDYLNNYSTIHNNPPFHEKEGILKTLNIYKNLETKEVFTTNIYPQRIKFENQNYLLWDNNLWDLYARFLVGINKYIKNENKFDICDYFFGLFLLFLSCRYDKIPSLSYFFADFGTKTNLIIPYSTLNYNNLINNLDDFENTFLFGKWFVFEHEIMHFKYGEDKKLYEKHAELVDKACKFICESLKHDNSLKNIKEKESYIYFYNVISNNKKYMEELCCDIFAIYNIVPIYSKLYYLPLNEAYGECFRLSRYIINFQNILNQIEDHWKNSYDYIKNIYLTPKKEYLNKTYNDIDKMVKEKKNKQNDQYNIRLFFVPMVSSITYQMLGINIVNTMTDITDFFSSDIYKYCFIPMIDNTVIGFEFTNKLYKYLISIYDKFSLTEFKHMRNKLIGWM